MLRDVLNALSEESQLDSAERRKFVEQEITYTDGTAGKRTAEYVLRVLNGRSHEKVVMTGKRNMTLFYFSIMLAICSSTLYHFSQKQIPEGVNPVISVIVTYIVSLILCFVLLYFLPPKEGILQAARQLNLRQLRAGALVSGPRGRLSACLPVGLEYRAGPAVLVNVVASLILIPVALLVFKDKLSWVNILGIPGLFGRAGHVELAKVSHTTSGNLKSSSS